MKFSDYRRMDGVNWSSLKLLVDSPKHFKYAMTMPREDKTSYSLGRAVHCAILEPEKFNSRYVVRPHGLDLRTADGKAWLADHRNMDLVPIDVDLIVKSINAHRPAMDILSNLPTEYTIQWSGHADVRCKARLDAVGSGRVVDLKTTSRPLDRFFIEAAQYHYHGQLAYYLDGAIAAGILPTNSVAYIIAAEKHPPYDVGVFCLSDPEISAGRVLYRHCIDQMLACTTAGLWPGRYPGVAPLGLPLWAEGMGRAEDAAETEEVW